MNYYEHGGKHLNVLDFSININPLGMKDEIKKYLTYEINNNIETLSKYPDNSNKDLVKEIAYSLSLKKENIIVGSGASELIMRINLALRCKKALLIAPCFSEYERSLKATKTKIKFHFLQEENSFILDNSILDSLKKDIDIFYLTNPNNPTGKLINPYLLNQIIEKCEKNNILLVLDESFIKFTRQESMNKLFKKNKYKNLIILYSFTKIYAMADLRLGYLIINNKKIKERIDDIKPSWNISYLVQNAAIKALSPTFYERKTLSLINKEKEFLYKELKNLEFKVYETDSNYILFKTNILNLDKKLLKKKIAIRNCENFKGLNKGFYRIAIKKREENIKLLVELKIIKENE